MITDTDVGRRGRQSSGIQASVLECHTFTKTKPTLYLALKVEPSLRQRQKLKHKQSMP